MTYKNYNLLNISILFLCLSILFFVKDVYCEGLQFYSSNNLTTNDINSIGTMDPVELYELAIIFENGDGQWRGKKLKKDSQISLELIIKSAQKGYFKAQFKLAMMYYNAENIKHNYAITRMYLPKAAEQNHPEAQFMMGLLYNQGIVFKKNEQLSIQWMIKSAENNYAQAQHYLARRYFNKNNFKSTLFWLEKSAEQNYQPAMVDLGNLYYHGKGTKKDYSKAVKLLQSPAQDKIILAQYLMGKIYYSGGYGIVQNQEKAEKWYKEAAALGSDDAIRDLKSITKLKIKTPDKKKTSPSSKTLSLDNNNFEKFHDDHYVIQIILAKKLQSIQKFIEQHKNFQLSICKISQNNQLFYVVTSGYFSHYSDAKLRLEELSGHDLFNKLNIWIIPVNKIKSLLIL